MELEKIKNKIQKLYTELLVKTFKAANPNATPEQIEEFLVTIKHWGSENPFFLKINYNAILGSNNILN